MIAVTLSTTTVIMKINKNSHNDKKDGSKFAKETIVTATITVTQNRVVIIIIQL